jgi:methionyl aminopeptidase
MIRRKQDLRFAVAHYANNKAKGTLQVGHVFTIEPMINLGGPNDVLWPA